MMIMVKETPNVASTRLTNDFSEQEEHMTASAMPPAFGLTAGAAAGGNVGMRLADAEGHRPHQELLQGLGLGEEEIEGLSEGNALQLVSISEQLSSGQWHGLRSAYVAHGHGMDFAAGMIDFYGRMVWNMDVDAQSLAVMADMPFQTVAGKKTGHVEMVRQGGEIGMRAVIPFEGFGGNLILNPECTSTVLGRSAECITNEDLLEQMNVPRGTNYFRFQQNMMVGKNEGGGNVLDVEDKTYSWALNNAWLQAAVDRRDKIRFISDPTKASTLFKRGGTIKDGLTVTGVELGVLMHRGMAPDVNTGEVKQGYRPAREETLECWMEIKDKVEEKGTLNEIDNDAYERYRNGCQNPALALKQYFSPEGELVATQSNFFGGSSLMESAA
jgi:hypothetical protein